MNIEHARTFLVIVDTGSFVAAADRLNITQSTVSARVRSIEEVLGETLLIRNRSGVTLTQGGRRFLHLAGQMVRAFERARREVGLPAPFNSRLTVGARIGLWDDLAVRWVAQIRQTRSQVSCRTESAFEPELMQGLVEGRIDVALMYTPQRRPNLELIPFITDSVVMVTTALDGSLLRNAYVHVDWGPEFDEQLQSALPDFPVPSISTNVGWLGLQHLKHGGGCGFFPQRLVQDQLEMGRLKIVENMPVFKLPAWIVVREDRNLDFVDPIIRDLIQNCV